MYFAEHRARLLDIAAFLDRADRARPGAGDQEFRLTALRRAVGILTDGRAERARRILELLSDHTAEMSQSAHGMKGALGAVPLPEPSSGAINAETQNTGRAGGRS
jgi:hypothetical protein